MEAGRRRETWDKVLWMDRGYESPGAQDTSVRTRISSLMWYTRPSTALLLLSSLKPLHIYLPWISQACWRPFISFTTELLLYLEWDPPTTLTLLGLAHFRSYSRLPFSYPAGQYGYPCPDFLCHTHPFIWSITFGLMLGCNFSLGGRSLTSLFRDLSLGSHTWSTYSVNQSIWQQRWE